MQKQFRDIMILLCSHDVTELPLKCSFCEMDLLIPCLLYTSYTIFLITAIIFRIIYFSYWFYYISVISASEKISP